jgi:hypothetical protein
MHEKTSQFKNYIKKLVYFIILFIFIFNYIFLFFNIWLISGLKCSFETMIENRSFTIERSWVRISSHPTLDGNGVKAMPGRLKYPILVHSIIDKKENTGSQMGHTKKIFNKKTFNQM